MGQPPSERQNDSEAKPPGSTATWDASGAVVGRPLFQRMLFCKVNTVDELVHAYDQTGTLCMILQEFIEFDQYVRCLCVGQDNIMPIKYDPQERRYHVEHGHLGNALGDRIVADARTLNRVLGYDMNSVEFAVRDGVPYAIDFMNPAPDMDVNSITPHYFEWAVKAMADLVIEMAHNPKPQRQEQRWARFVE